MILTLKLHSFKKRDTETPDTIEGNQSQSTSRPVVVEEPEVNKAVYYSFPPYLTGYIRKSGFRTLKNFCVRNPESWAWHP